jgi:Leucine-rich repeat (LRR) protein
MLDVEGTSFAFDGIPSYISQLTELKILDVSETLFIGELDGSIFEPLTELMYLEMGGNLYNSTLPQQIIDLPNLEAFYAYESGLTGDIGFLPSMSKIVEIWLDENPDLGGTIPTEVGQLTNIKSLSATNCDMWGQIPSEIGKLTLMEQMWFYGNWFSGTIPSEFASLPNLKILGLEDNNITDVSMPAEMCNKGMLALSADCGGEYNMVDCPVSCCTCCEAPCPIVNLPESDSGRLLKVQDEIRRL